MNKYSSGKKSKPLILLACDTYTINPWVRDRLPAIWKIASKWNIEIIDIYQFVNTKRAHYIHSIKANNYFNQYNINKINRKFYKKIISFNPKILILGTIDNYIHFLLPETIEKIRQEGVFVVGIFGDDEFTYNRNKIYTLFFDKIVVYVKSITAIYNTFKPNISYYLPNSCHLKDDNFDNLQIVESDKAYDVLLVGAPFGIRIQIVKALIKENINIAIFGSDKWHDFPEIKKYYKGYIDSNKFDDIVKKSKIILALLEDHISGSMHMNTKLWEAVRVGQFALTSYYEPLISDYGFIEKQDIIFYRSVDDLVDKCNYYISHPLERIQIAKNIFDKVKNKFDYLHLYNDLFKYLGDYIYSDEYRSSTYLDYAKQLITIIDYSKGIDYYGFNVLYPKNTNNLHLIQNENFEKLITTPYVILANDQYKYSSYLNKIISNIKEDFVTGVIVLKPKYRTIKNETISISNLIWETSEFILMLNNGDISESIKVKIDNAKLLETPFLVVEKESCYLINKFIHIIKSIVKKLIIK